MLAKAGTDYFRNPNRREEFAICSPDSRMVIRKLDVRYGAGEFTLYRIGPDGALAGDIDLTKIVEPAVRARLRQIGRNPTDYVLLIGVIRQRGIPRRINNARARLAPFTVPNEEL